VVVDDLVHGPITFDSAELDDLIIARSDGTPTYNFCVVVDDYDMQITHVIRGDDHINNTPRQMQMLRALGVEPPRYAHVPMILGPDGAKLSKRHGAVSVLQYRDDGFLPEGLLNYLGRLGWSHGDQEIFSAAQIIEHFDLAHVGRSGAQADLAKLAWLNQHYIKARSPETLFAAASPFLDAVAGRSVVRDPSLDKLLDLLRERATRLDEMAQKARFALVDEVEVEPGAADKHLRPAVQDALEKLIEALETLEAWTTPAIESAFERACKAAGDLKLGKLAQPVRVAVTGTTASPGIFETLEVAGRTRVLARLRRAVEAIRARAETTTGSHEAHR
jgi:glutamyl-tRNA synthetase